MEENDASVREPDTISPADEVHHEPPTDLSETASEPFSIIKFHFSVNTGTGSVDVLCLEFSTRLLFFIGDTANVGTVIEARPEDPVDLGNPTTYSTTVVFGSDKEDLSYQLLARRLVEVLRKRMLVAVSRCNMPMTTVRLIEESVLRQFNPGKQLNMSQTGSLTTAIAP